MDMGDHVVVINASKIALTSDKAETKVSYRHSGYPGGLKTDKTSEMLANRPEEVIRKAVRGMLPKGTLGRQMGAKLKIYAGPEHPHDAQGPQPYEIPHAKFRRGRHAAELA